MKCPIETHETSEVLLAYFARKLDPGTAATLECHMASCPACRKIYEGQRAVWEALDAWDALPVPADFDRRLYCRIEEDLSSPWWLRAVRPLRPTLMHRALPIAAAACLLVVAGAIMESPSHPAPGEPEVKAETIQADQVERSMEDIELLHAFGQEVRAQASSM
jgi:anti-sigma factor RsiW